MIFDYHSPNEVTLEVKQLLEKFEGANYELVYVDIKTELTAVKSECYNNVAEKIKSEGGRTRYGWSVYDNTYFIEAEKHAIWESPDGDLIDVSIPNSENIHRIMFLMDDVNHGIYVPNIRCNYNRSKAIDDYFTIVDLLDVLILNYANESVDIKNLFIFPISLRERVTYLFELISEYISYIKSNIKYCICGSTKLYKDCHNDRFVQDLINDIDKIIIDNKLIKN